MDTSLAGDEKWECGGELLGSISRKDTEYSDGQDRERMEAVFSLRRVDQEQERRRICRAFYVLFIRR